MSSYQLFFDSFREKAWLSASDEERIRGRLTTRKLRKRQFLLQEGTICDRFVFVLSGALYSYSIDAKGALHVIQFAFFGWWIGDLYSFLTKEPSRLNIEALEDCELLIIGREDHAALLKEVPQFETYMRLLYQNAYVALQRRLEGTLGLPAEEKYMRLLGQYPDILNSVPLHLIASYLGVTPETISRIRKQIMP